MFKVLITPHVAAINKVKLIAEFFKDNLERYREGMEMMATIDFSKEY